MTTTKMGHDNCPICKKTLDAVTSVLPGKIPAPRDITICAYCAALLQFYDDMTLVKLPKQVYDSFDYETRAMILKAQKVIINSRLQIN
mgnify:CR=1 FL=1